LEYDFVVIGADSIALYRSCLFPGGAPMRSGFTINFRKPPNAK